MFRHHLGLLAQLSEMITWRYGHWPILTAINLSRKRWFNSCMPISNSQAFTSENCISGYLGCRWALSSSQKPICRGINGWWDYVLSLIASFWKIAFNRVVCCYSSNSRTYPPKIARQLQEVRYRYFTIGIWGGRFSASIVVIPRAIQRTCGGRFSVDNLIDTLVYSQDELVSFISHVNWKFQWRMKF